MSTTKDNVINVSFSPNCCATTVTPRYQWDKGVVLCIKNIQPKESVFLHCSFEGQRTPAYVMTTELKDGNLYGVIPDEMFQQAKQIRCYLYMDNSENGTTIFEVAIPVIPRAKPSDYIYDPMEVIPDVGELLSAWNTVRDVSEKASQVANMTVEAGTLPAGSAATASYQDGKLTLGIPRGLDSETALPTGYKPFDMLVVGPDGKPRWEERTHYDYTGGGTILPLTDLQLVGGYCTFKDPFDNIPVVGFPYHVTYYGYDYNLIAKEWMEDGVRCVTLGNQRDLGGTDWTQEPFVIVFYPEKSIFGTYGYFSCSATSKDTMPVSIESAGVLKKIDPKFLSEGSGGGLPTGGEPYKQLATDGEGNAVWADRLAYEEASGMVEILPEQVQSIVTAGNPIMIDNDNFKEPIKLGEIYIVTYNGQDYEVEPQPIPGAPSGMFVLGNYAKAMETGDTGEPFYLAYVPDEFVDDSMSSSFATFDGLVDFTFAIAKKTGGAIHTIPPKYLPDGIGYETEGGVVLPETELVEEGGMFMTQQPLHQAFVKGAEYTVMWNGVPYKCKADLLTADGISAIVLGNIGATGLGEVTEEPFLIMDYTALSSGMVTIAAVPIDGSESVTLAISGGSQVHKIDPKYLPEGIGYETPNTLTLVMEACNIIHDPGGDYRTENTLTEDLVAGAEYTLILDDAEYKTICKTTDAEIAPFVLGNPAMFGGEDTGEPFTFFCGGKAGEYLWYGGSNNDFLQSTIEVFKGSSGGIHTIPMKYLPDYLYGQEGDMSEVLPENVPGDSVDGMYAYSVFVPFASHMVPGKEYIVTYNGEEYRCTCKISGYMDYPCVGNMSLTDYPFYVVDCMVENTDGSNDVEYGKAELKDSGATISIRNGGILRKIDPKFLPEGIGGGLPTGGEPYKQLVTDGEGNAVWEDRPCYMDMGVEIFPETTLEIDPEQDGMAYIFTPWTNAPVAGETYTVIYNGNAFACEAVSVDEDGDGVDDIYAFGNLGFSGLEEDNGMPFCLMLVVPSMGDMMGMYGMVRIGDGSTSVSISVGQGDIKKINPVLLPPLPEHKHEPMKIYISRDETPSERSEHQAYRDAECTIPLTTDDLEVLDKGREFEVCVYDPHWEIHAPCKPMCYCNFLHHWSMPDPMLGVAITYASNLKLKTALCFLKFQVV